MVSRAGALRPLTMFGGCRTGRKARPATSSHIRDAAAGDPRIAALRMRRPPCLISRNGTSPPIVPVALTTLLIGFARMASSYSTTTDYRGRPGPAHAHPVHAILSAFPLALFTSALVADIAYTNTANMQWANFAVWLIAGGCLGGVLAAVAGIGDALLFRRRRHAAVAGGRVHAIGTSLMLVLGIVNAFIHSRDAWTSVVPTGLVLSLIVTVLALVTSWQGFVLQARETR